MHHNAGHSTLGTQRENCSQMFGRDEPYFENQLSFKTSNVLPLDTGELTYCV